MSGPILPGARRDDARCPGPWTAPLAGAGGSRQDEV